MSRELSILAQHIAEKTRTFIPRSVNRSDHPESPGISRWDTGARPMYQNLQLCAMYAASSMFAREKCFILSLDMDMDIYDAEREGALNTLYLKQLKRYYGWDPDYIRHLGGQMLGTRNKRYHRYKRKLTDLFSDTSSKVGPVVTTRERMEREAKNAIRFGVGNCDECSSLAFLMFAEFRPEKPIREVWRRSIFSGTIHVEKIEGGQRGEEHCFVVIGRDLGAVELPRASDYESYQQDGVIICDPWWFDHGGILEHSRGSFQMGGPDRDKKRSLHSWLERNATTLKTVDHIPLGSGEHSARFRGKKMYRGLSYLYNPIEKTKQYIKDVYKKKYRDHFAEAERLKEVAMSRRRGVRKMRRLSD